MEIKREVLKFKKYLGVLNYFNIDYNRVYHCHQDYQKYNESKIIVPVHLGDVRIILKSKL